MWRRVMQCGTPPSTWPVLSACERGSSSATSVTWEGARAILITAPCSPLPQADTEFLAAREKQMEEWREWQATKAEWAAEQAEAKKALLGDRLRDGDFTVQLAEVTVVLEVKEEAVKL